MAYPKPAVVEADAATTDPEPAAEDADAATTDPEPAVEARVADDVAALEEKVVAIEKEVVAIEAQVRAIETDSEERVRAIDARLKSVQDSLDSVAGVPALTQNLPSLDPVAAGASAARENVPGGDTRTPKAPVADERKAEKRKPGAKDTPATENESAEEEAATAVEPVAHESATEDQPAVVEPPATEPAGKQKPRRPAQASPSAAPPATANTAALPRIVPEGRPPGAAWRPYSNASPFNQRIPEDARLHPNSDAIVNKVNGFGDPSKLTVGAAKTEGDWSHPTFYSKPSDPEFTIRCGEQWGKCEVEGQKVRIPEEAQPAAGGDGHMTVVDPASGWEWDFWQVGSKPSGGGQLDIAWGGRTAINGDGLGSDATAARFGNLAGVIRAPEWEAGEIDHALFMTINCDSGSFVYPAAKSGRACSETGKSNADAPPMGARFQLNMTDAQIAALPVPQWKKPLLRAMARYGMYFGDTGGGSSWGIQAESGATYTSFGREDAMVSFARKQGVPTYNGTYVFDIADKVDWGRYLRVIDPCVAERTC